MDKYKDNDLTAIIAAIIFSNSRTKDMDTAVIDARYLLTQVRK